MFRAAFFGPAPLRQLVFQATSIVAVSAAAIAHATTALSTSAAPTIAGSPATVAFVGSAYAFRPSARDASGHPLSFSIRNKPAWANFSIATGSLYGAPTSAEAGTYGGIEISVSDGRLTATLPAFSITVRNRQTPASTGRATISWAVPTENNNGTPLTNLAGVLIYYGPSGANLDKVVQVSSPLESSYTIGNLAAGAWYFAVAAYTSAGTQSPLSQVVSKSIP